MGKISPWSGMKTNRKVFELLSVAPLEGKRVLDLGAGSGFFSANLKEYIEQQGWDPKGILEACDYSPDAYDVPGIQYSKVDLNRFPYPYEDGTFDFILAIEVVEHLENQFDFIRECYRMLKPGGKLLITTPNVLNMNSRLRYLLYGFAELFGPLPMRTADRQSTGGHVHPVSYYYLSYMMVSASFLGIEFHFDRLKRSSWFWALVLFPFLLFGRLYYHRNEKRRNGELVRENSSYLKTMNGFKVLTSRTIILEGMK